MTSLATGILVGVRHQGRPAVALQIRGENETSFKGGSQVTAHGKLEGDELTLPQDEGFREGLKREVREELGDVLAEMIEAASSDVVTLNEQTTPKKTIRTFGVDLKISSDEFLQKVVLGKEVGGFTFVTPESKIRPYSDGEKEHGVPTGETAMFPDEIEAVNLAFEKLFP